MHLAIPPIFLLSADRMLEPPVRAALEKKQ